MDPNSITHLNIIKQRVMQMMMHLKNDKLFPTLPHSICTSGMCYNSYVYSLLHPPCNYRLRWYDSTKQRVGLAALSLTPLNYSLRVLDAILGYFV